MAGDGGSGMTCETIVVSTDADGIATLRLNRPEKHNTLSGRMIAELTDAAAAAGADPAVRMVVLTGTGDSFCAGGDLAWMQAQVAGDAASRRKAATGLAMMLHELNALPKPLIGRINGQAFGGGVGLMAVCDAAIGVTGAQFGLTETRLGLIPATIGPYVLARIGGTAARRYLMASRVFDADTACRIGLLADVVPASGLDQAILAETTPYLACAPGAVAAAKALIRRLTGAPDPDMIAETVGLLVKRWESAEAAEGIAAFFEKRPPVWG